MKIPIIKASEELPRIPATATTEGAGRTWKAAGQLSGVVRDIGLDLAETQQRITRAREVAQSTITMEAANRDIVAKLRLKPNHETYFEDWLSEFQFASTDMLIKAKGVRTKEAMEQVFSQMAAREARQQKDYANQLWLETEQTEVAKALEGYATEGRYEDGVKLIDSVKALYGPKELLALKGKFKTSYDAIQKELSDVKADQAIMRNPNQALIDLQNKDYLPNLEPMQRQDKVEKAKAAAKVWENEQEQKLKEAEKAEKEEEEGAIGDAYKAHDYKKAYSLLLASKHLSGTEERVWTNALKDASSGKSITTDYMMYSNLSLRASQGIIDDPTELYGLIGKGLTIQNVKDIQKIMKDVADPEKKHETELMNLAIGSGSKMVIKGNLFTGFDAGEIRDAYLFEHALRKELESEKDRAKRLNMLTPGTSEYIVDKVLAPYLKDPITRMRETADKIRGKAKPEKTEGEISKRKKRETIEEYLKRTGQR